MNGRVFRIISDVTTHIPSLSLYVSSLTFFPHSPSLPLQGMTSLPKAHILICCRRTSLQKITHRPNAHSCRVLGNKNILSTNYFMGQRGRNTRYLKKHFRSFLLPLMEMVFSECFPSSQLQRMKSECNKYSRN